MRTTCHTTSTVGVWPERRAPVSNVGRPRGSVPEEAAGVLKELFENGEAMQTRVQRVLENMMQTGTVPQDAAPLAPQRNLQRALPSTRRAPVRPASLLVFQRARRWRGGPGPRNHWDRQPELRRSGPRRGYRARLHVHRRHGRGEFITDLTEDAPFLGWLAGTVMSATVSVSEVSVDEFRYLRVRDPLSFTPKDEEDGEADQHVLVALRGDGSVTFYLVLHGNAIDGWTPHVYANGSPPVLVAQRTRGCTSTMSGDGLYWWVDAVVADVTDRGDERFRAAVRAASRSRIRGHKGTAEAEPCTLCADSRSLCCLPCDIGRHCGFCQGCIYTLLSQKGTWLSFPCQSDGWPTGPRPTCRQPHDPAVLVDMLTLSCLVVRRTNALAVCMGRPKPNVMTALAIGSTCHRRSVTVDR